MRFRYAHGLAILLSFVSLGATQGPTSSESGRTQSNQANHLPVVLKRPHNRSGHPKPYQVGTASWYGSDFDGKPTASGEPYNMYDLTAAHPTLPLGTYVRVTNLHNGRVITVRINDRGPIVPNRIIDLSYGAARALKFRERGIQRVRLDIVQPELLARLQHADSPSPMAE